MPRVYKAIAAVVVLGFLFAPEVQNVLPKMAWSILFIGALTYGMSLLLAPEIPVRRRLGMSYLMFAGVSYLTAGIFGLLPNWGLIETAAWNSLVSPYPLLTILWHGVPRSPDATEWANIYVLPHGEHLLFSVIVVALGLIGITAAFLMSKEMQAAYWVWFAFIGIFVVSAAGHAVAAFVRWGPKDSILPTCWVASYIFAFAMALRGTELRRRGS